MSKDNNTQDIQGLVDESSADTATRSVNGQEESDQETAIESKSRDAQAEDTSRNQSDDAESVQSDGQADTDSMPDGESTDEETPEETIRRLEQELAEAHARADQYLDQMQRTAAEFQNARKRQEKLATESINRATERLISKLLPVLDDLDLAFDNVPESLDQTEAAWLEGFTRIRQKLQNTFFEEGLAPIEPDGEFDPNRHEAVTNEPSDEVESGHIIATLRTGYEFKDKVLRPALVRVAQ